MLYLVKKELTANARYMLIGFVFFILYMFIFAQTDAAAALFIMCLVTFFYMISTTNMVVDERYKIDLLLTTLPLRRKDVVRSKYLLILVIFVASFVFYTLIAFLARAAGNDTIPMLTFTSVAAGLLIISVFNGIMMPLAYKFGAQATRYVSFILFFAVFFSSSFLKNLDLSGFQAFFQQLDTVASSLLIFAAAVAVNLISYAIACPIYVRKDL